ncbi:MAG: histidine kinase [Treponema sp.]|nr:histidine kinase [Treponema sp.]
MLKNASLKFKITLSVLVYIIVIGVIGNIFLFVNLQEAVFFKAEQLDKAYMKAARFRLDRNMENVFSLAVINASNPSVSRLISRQDRSEREIILDSLRVQEQINAFLTASPIGPYIDKMILFNHEKIFVQAQGRQQGSPMDVDNIMRQPLYAKFIEEDLSWAAGFGRSITASNPRDSYILLFRVGASSYTYAEAFLYIEAGIDMITNVLGDYSIPTKLFLQIPATGEILLQNSSRIVQPQPGSLGYITPNSDFPLKFRQGRNRYRLDKMPLGNENFALYNQADITGLAFDDRQTFYIMLATVLVSLFTAAGLGFLMSASFSKPIHALIGKIKKISEENDFSHDPEIEKSGDEIGRIGKAVNEMSGSIVRYLETIEEQYHEQKNTEFVLLQTQINPHFLYNTLDSIQWIAKVQNNKPIADIINRLINLLRGIIGHTKTGEVHKITLAEELLFLEDYTEIMSLRFMGSFEVVNKIPKDYLNCRIPQLTLQPLVENAILHGIAPSNKFGSITLSAATSTEETSGKNFLDITIEDTGAGISEEQLAVIKTATRKNHSGNPSLNNIGIANVENRIKMRYGESCGLFFESQPGEYTKVTARIKMEY